MIENGKKILHKKKISMPKKFKDESILESIPNLQIALGYNKPTKFYNFLFYDDKNLNYYKDKVDNVDEEKFVAKRWVSSNAELNLIKIDEKGYGDVLGMNGSSILRLFIKKDDNKYFLSRKGNVTSKINNLISKFYGLDKVYK